MYNAIIALKAQYPDGTPWGDDKLYQIWAPISTGELYSINCYGCAAFTQMCQDAAFGDAGTGKFAKVTHYDSFDDIRVGDIVRYDGHEVIVLKKSRIPSLLPRVILTTPFIGEERSSSLKISSRTRTSPFLLAIPPKP